MASKPPSPTAAATAAARNAPLARTIAVARGITPTAPTVGSSAGQRAIGVAKGGVPDPNKGLTGSTRDAAIALETLFNSYGLGSLSGTIVKYLQNGYDSDTISVLLQDTDAYKQRFAANATRLKNGLPVLSPAEYISTENSYRQVMSAAGLPVGFYDSTSDFQKLLENDVSPTEVQSRVATATEAINQAPPETVNFFKQFYNSGDLIAYALDPKVAQPLIDSRIKAAESAAVAQQNGLSLSQSASEDIGRGGSSLANIQSGLSFVAQESKTDDKLSQLYGGAVTSDDLVSEVFDNNAVAAQKRQVLASKERASFAGTSAQGKTSLSKDDGGF